VKNVGIGKRACTQVLFPLAGRDFFRQVRELKIQTKNPGNALRTIINFLNEAFL
jgi:hypothetical protein